MTAKNEQETKGFNEAYATLQKNAEKLRSQDDLDVDSLVPIVKASAEAYAICKARIASVRAALADDLKEDTP